METVATEDEYEKYSYKDTSNYQKDEDDNILDMLGDYESGDLALDDTSAFDIKFNEVDIATAVEDANTTVSNVQGYYLTEVKKAQHGSVINLVEVNNN